MTNHDSRTDAELLELSAQLLDLQVNSFIDLAIRFPDLWRRLSAPPLRRRLAAILVWPKQFIPELFDQMTLMDFIAIFLNAGPESLEEIWLKHAAAADYLRQTGRLQRVIDSLQIPSKTEAYPNEADFFVNRCRVAGCFEAWRDIDRPGFAAALKQGQLSAVAFRVPRRPVGGYPTVGGEVLTTAQLIVARILEAAGVTFLANRTVDPSPGKRRATRHLVDFIVSDQNTGLVILSAERCGGCTVLRSQCTRLKRAWRRQGGRILELDGQLLQGDAGLTAFVGHVRVQLSKAGIIPRSLRIDPLHCLRLEAVSEPVGDDGGRR